MCVLKALLKGRIMSLNAKSSSIQGSGGGDKASRVGSFSVGDSSTQQSQKQQPNFLVRALSKVQAFVSGSSATTQDTTLTKSLLADDHLGGSGTQERRAEPKSELKIEIKSGTYTPPTSTSPKQGNLNRSGSRAQFSSGLRLNDPSLVSERKSNVSVSTYSNVATVTNSAPVMSSSTTTSSTTSVPAEVRVSINDNKDHKDAIANYHPSPLGQVLVKKKKKKQPIIPRALTTLLRIPDAKKCPVDPLTGAFMIVPVVELYKEDTILKTKPQPMEAATLIKMALAYDGDLLLDPRKEFSGKTISLDQQFKLDTDCLQKLRQHLSDHKHTHQEFLQARGLSQEDYDRVIKKFKKPFTLRQKIAEVNLACDTLHKELIKQSKTKNCMAITAAITAPFLLAAMRILITSYSGYFFDTPTTHKVQANTDLLKMLESYHRRKTVTLDNQPFEIDYLFECQSFDDLKLLIWGKPEDHGSQWGYPDISVTGSAANFNIFGIANDQSALNPTFYTRRLVGGEVGFDFFGVLLGYLPSGFILRCTLRSLNSNIKRTLGLIALVSWTYGVENFMSLLKAASTNLDDAISIIAGCNRFSAKNLVTGESVTYFTSVEDAAPTSNISNILVPAGFILAYLLIVAKTLAKNPKRPHYTDLPDKFPELTYNLLEDSKDESCCYRCRV